LQYIVIVQLVVRSKVAK